MYFKIVTGEHISKNYILPLEKYILDNLDTSSTLPIMSFGGQQSIFLIRYFLKIGSLYGLLQYWREIEKYLNEWKSYNHQNEFQSVPELDLSNESLYKMKYAYESSSFLKKLFYH